MLEIKTNPRTCSESFSIVSLMVSCMHSSWLTLYGCGYTFLRQNNTLTNLLSSLENPEKQMPSLVCLLEETNNSRMLRNLLPKPRRNGRCKPDVIHLQLDQKTLFSDHPILFAHGHFMNSMTLHTESEKFKCHNNTLLKFDWPVEALLDTTQATNALFCQLLSPFTHVMCIFIPSESSIPALSARLKLWLELSKNRKTLLLPRLLIVAGVGEPALVERKLFKSVGRYELLSMFSTVKVCRQGSHTLDVIRREASYASIARRTQHILFNAVHFDQMFRRASEHFVSASLTPFDLYQASRVHRPVPANLQDDITYLLETVKSCRELIDISAPYIGGLLALDNYANDVSRLYHIST
jgi:hypothetical protein